MNEGVLAHLKSVTAALDLTGTPYRLIRPIGRGGMGAVYLVEDPRLGREVALKVLDVGGDDRLAARLELEARIIARLEHPGIVPVHDVGRLADGRVFYVMKFVRGERLDAWFGRGQPLATVLRLFQRICEAVAFAHARGVVHRDLKPQNVMIGEYGEALVMDWGLARDADGAEDGVVMGTPGFMAPEQVRGEAIDARADVFALGAMLYFLLSGRQAFESPSAKAVLSATPLPLGQPRPLVAICDKTLRKDRAERYANAGFLGADIGAFLDGLAVTAHRETLIEKVLRGYQKYKVLVLLVVAYLVMRTLVALIAGR